MLNYLKGDATSPIETGGYRYIIHICNNRGGWGAGFVLALSKRWPEPEAYYRRWFKEKKDFMAGRFQLGAIQLVPVEEGLTVINMIAQEGYGKNNQAQHQGVTSNSKPPIRYDALEMCLKQVDQSLPAYGSVHMPRIGTGLAGGSWREIEPIIQKTLADVDVYVYDL